jgi:hypothetical protein
VRGVQAAEGGGGEAVYTNDAYGNVPGSTAGAARSRSATTTASIPHAPHTVAPLQHGYVNVQDAAAQARAIARPRSATTTASIPHAPHTVAPLQYGYVNVQDAAAQARAIACGISRGAGKRNPSVYLGFDGAGDADDV